MHFATPIPWWLALPVVAGMLALSFWAYRRPLMPLSLLQRAALTACRALALLAVFAFICRPVILRPPKAAGGTVVPVLVDLSRSMRIADADGETRFTRARGIARQVAQGLSGTATVELFGFSDQVIPLAAESLAADGRTTRIAAALDTIRGRYRGLDLRPRLQTDGSR